MQRSGQILGLTSRLRALRRHCFADANHRFDRTITVNEGVHPLIEILGMFWRTWLALLLILAYALPAGAEQQPHANGTLTPTLDAKQEFKRPGELLRDIPTIRDLLERAGEKAYSKCLRRLGEAELCECITNRIPLKLDLLCYIRVVERTKE
ncbi:MAG: hypothetical protein ACE5NW_01395 [Acidiferrobacterales bacterium]